MDDVAALHVEAGRDDGCAGVAAAKFPKSIRKLRTSSVVNSAVDARPSGQVRVSCVYDRVSILSRDVAKHHLND